MKSLFPYAIGLIVLGLTACTTPPTPEQTVYMQNLGFELRIKEGITSFWVNPETRECAVENSWEVYGGFRKPTIMSPESCFGSA